jgi:hypothetical protein
MLTKAETRERRQRRLEHFFREAYALTFGLKPGERQRRRSEEQGDAGDVVMRTSLSRAEFASALGMKPDDVFVRMMFNIVDKDGDGRISFQVTFFFFINEMSFTSIKFILNVLYIKSHCNSLLDFNNMKVHQHNIYVLGISGHCSAVLPR